MSADQQNVLNTLKSISEVTEWNGTGTHPRVNCKNVDITYAMTYCNHKFKTYIYEVNSNDVTVALLCHCGGSTNKCSIDSPSLFV